MTPLQLEELSLSEWPALETQFLDGWILRFSQGYTKRSNSVSPLYGEAADDAALEQRVRTCEGLYAAHGLPTIFKLTGAADSRLDPLLDRRGYRVVDPSLVLVRDLPGEFSQRDGNDAEVLPRDQEEWLDWAAGDKGLMPSEAAVFRQLTTTGSGEVFHLRLRNPQGLPVSGATGAVNRGWLGILNVFTAAEHRRQGLARRMMEALLAAGAAKGASKAYLAVIQSNSPALALYSGLGFKPHYTYWYRVKNP